MATKLEYLVVDFGLAKQLEPSAFCTTVYVWVEDDSGFGLMERDHTCPSGGTHRIGHPGELVYPAPTMSELMRAVKREICKSQKVTVTLGQDYNLVWDAEAELSGDLFPYVSEAKGSYRRPEDLLAQLWLRINAGKKRRRAMRRKEKNDGQERA